MVHTLSGPMVYALFPCFLFSQGNGMHHRCFFSAASGSGDRAREEGLSGPVLRVTARLSQGYPPIVRCGVFGAFNMANWV